MLIDNICLLVTSQSREVVNPSISFLHVFIQVQPVMESAKFCEKIVNSLCKMTEDCKRHFRLKTRQVLQLHYYFPPEKGRYQVIANVLPSLAYFLLINGRYFAKKRPKMPSEAEILPLLNFPNHQKFPKSSDFTP